MPHPKLQIRKWLTRGGERARTMFTAIKISHRVVAVLGNLLDRGRQWREISHGRETISRDNNFPNERLEKNTLKFRFVNRAVENTAHKSDQLLFPLSRSQLPRLYNSWSTETPTRKWGSSREKLWPRCCGSTASEKWRGRKREEKKTDCSKAERNWSCVVGLSPCEALWAWYVIRHTLDSAITRWESRRLKLQDIHLEWIDNSETKYDEFYNSLILFVT